MEPALFVCIAIAMVVVFRLIAGSMDGSRIEDYLRARGARLRTKHWAPFGTGWFGEKNARIYEVEYESRDGELRRATVKTSLFSGVYLTDDRAARPRRAAPPVEVDGETQRLRAENERLAAEVERLKRLD